MDIIENLKQRASNKHRDFLAKLIPNIEKDRILGVKVADIRVLKKEVDADFLRQLPHAYYEENMLHVFLLNDLAEEALFPALERFFPYLDNWSVVDSLDPKVFYGKKSYMSYFISLTTDSRPFVQRAGIVLAIKHIKEDADFAVDQLKQVKSQDYYVKMALAWFFAEAVLYCKDKVICLLQAAELDPWVNNKAIQKIKESRRVEETVKETVDAFRR